MTRRSAMFIDGAWRQSESSESFTVIDPHSEQPYAEVTLADESDVDLAVETAQRALHGAWAEFSLQQRIDCVIRLRALVEARREELASITTHCMGAPYQSALWMAGALEMIDMYVDAIQQLELEYVRSDRFGHALIRRRPVGVVAGIVPWNAVVRSEVKKTVPSLLCGCTVVLKPAPETPFAAGLLAEMCIEAGIPPGVVNAVPGSARAGEHLVQHRSVRKIAFTGSSATGARIASLTAPDFKRLQLELGGKSAAILMDDVDLTSAMPALAAGAWANSGQGCYLNTRVLAPRSRYEEVIDAFGAAAKQHTLGDPMDPATTLGPLVSRRQWERVLSYVEIGVKEGARLVTGGGRPSHLQAGFYVAPTVFADVDNNMTIAQQEIFGPVTVVIPYDGLDEAISLANASDYGLGGSVFGADENLALAVARQIDTGSVAINGFGAPASAPFGGVKSSGVSREHGPEGFDSFLEYTTYGLTPTLASELTAANIGNQPTSA